MKHATIHCPYCDRAIEAYDCVEMSELIQWLKDHNGFSCIDGLMLNDEDWQYLLNWGRK
ncbi:hypothetical protein LCGC14_1686990 [marine sediment metagenome]|uniref:Uncharacterized protein n=1 Tax=marine sediment metagenome TaxID=412755 RepID=A0A0F9I9F7_9ZZZZ